jgi:hypothetical protein
MPIAKGTPLPNKASPRGRMKHVEPARMLSEYQEYERATIPAGTYPANPADVHTFGVRPVVVMTARMPDVVAYDITSAVFDHFDDFPAAAPCFRRAVGRGDGPCDRTRAGPRRRRAPLARTRLAAVMARLLLPTMAAASLIEHLRGRLALAASSVRPRDDDLSGRGRARVDGERQAELPPERRIMFRMGVSATPWSRARMCSVTASTSRHTKVACRPPARTESRHLRKSQRILQQQPVRRRRASRPSAP